MYNIVLLGRALTSVPRGSRQLPRGQGIRLREMDEQAMAKLKRPWREDGGNGRANHRHAPGALGYSPLITLKP